MAPLTRRGRRLAHGAALLTSGMWLVGTAYNFCWPHARLRVRVSGARTWQKRTPAMAAGLTDHVWTLDEVLRYPVPSAEGTSPPRQTDDVGRGAHSAPGVRQNTPMEAAA